VIYTKDRLVMPQWRNGVYHRWMGVEHPVFVSFIAGGPRQPGLQFDWDPALGVKGNAFGPVRSERHGKGAPRSPGPAGKKGKGKSSSPGPAERKGKGPMVKSPPAFLANVPPRPTPEERARAPRTCAA
jgi:hypothetical protein